MFLHNDKELFEEIIHNTSTEFVLPIAIVEKDYYVTEFLRAIVAVHPDIIFKGGTSLSKCYKLIERFSEDIDLNVAGNSKPSQKKRKELRDDILKIINDFGFSLTNPESIGSGRDYNKYIINFSSIHETRYLNQHLIVETAFFLRSHPFQVMTADSYVYNYLQKHGHEEIISNFNLRPFSINVQHASRTFIDKLFALGDYYLSESTGRHSRHIYDLYKLREIVQIDDELKLLAKVVREERSHHTTCYSAKPDIDIKKILRQIIENSVYKEDYQLVTKELLFTPVPYEVVITVLSEVIDSGLFE